jgi:hypothetical protein
LDPSRLLKKSICFAVPAGKAGLELFEQPEGFFSWHLGTENELAL